MDSNQKNGGYILLIIISLASIGLSIAAIIISLNKESKENMSSTNSTQYYVLDCSTTKPTVKTCKSENCTNQCSGKMECLINNDENWLEDYAKYVKLISFDSRLNAWNKVMCNKTKKSKTCDSDSSKYLNSFEKLISKWNVWGYVTRYAETGASEDQTKRFLKAVLGITIDQ